MSDTFRKLARRGPPPLLLVALLCLLAAQPYLAARFPSSADGKLHLYRLIEFDHALRHGVLFPRWSPDLVFGYGFPLFNYYAPLVYYAGAAFHLTGLSYPLATQATFVALVLLAGWATYAWVRDAFGPLAGLAGAAAYVYAPYVGHTTVHRGALAEMAGLALMPLIAWAFFRLSRGVSSGRFVAAAASVGTLLLAHNLTSLLFAPVLAGGIVALWLAEGRDRRSGLAMLGAAVVGLALGAIFWLPAFAERDLVQIDRLFGPAAFDFRLAFLSARDLLLPPRPMDPHQLAQPFAPALGLPQVGLALVGMWRAWRGGLARREATLVVVAGGGALTLVLLATRLSLPLWEAIGLLRFVQFPWRMLGPASLLLAFVVGAAFADADAWRADLRRLATGLAVAAMAAYGLWWLFGDAEPPLAAETVQDVQQFEVAYDAAGTTSFVDYLPVTVAELPPANGLAARYASGDVIARVSDDELPEGAAVLSQEAGLRWAEASVESTDGFRLTWDWFAFPGWRATVDGQPVAIRASEPHGLMQVDVPPGQHEVAIRLGPTPVRRAAGLISLAGVVVTGALAWWLPAMRDGRQRRTLRWRDALPMAGVLALLVVKVATLDHAESPFRRSRFDGQTLSGIDAPARVLFEDQMVFLGHTGGTRSIAAGETLAPTLYWTTQGTVTADFSTSVTLVDRAGQVVAQDDSQHPGNWPTSRWERGEYAADAHRLLIPADTPPGAYELRASVYEATRRLVPLDEAGNPAGTTLRVAEVTVTRATTPPDPAQVAVETRLDAQITPALELAGTSLSAHETQPGDPLVVELVWHALATPEENLTATLGLRDDAGDMAFEEDVPLASAAYPTSAWRAGEVLRGRHRLVIPASIEGGTYRLVVSVPEGASIVLGSIEVTALPPSVFEPPPMDGELGLEWPGGITLLGYDLSGGGTLRLYWRTENETSSSYKSFVHLVDEAGDIAVQRDQIPAAWTRPTPSWRGGEVISDTFTLDLSGLPPGTYSLRVGLYDERSLARLPLADGEADFADLGEIRLPGR